MSAVSWQPIVDSFVNLFTPNQDSSDGFSLQDGGSSSTSSSSTVGSGDATLLVQGQGGRNESIPSAGRAAIDALAGGSADLSQINSRLIPSWASASTIQPPLSQEALTYLRGEKGRSVGLAFNDENGSYAVVSQEELSRWSQLNGIPESQALGYFQTQEVAQAWHQKEKIGPRNLTAEESRTNELIGEAAGAAVSPSAAFSQAIGYLTLPQSAWNPGYDLFLGIAKDSIGQTLEAAGFKEIDGKSPGEAFVAGFTEQWKADYGKRPKTESLRDFAEKFIKEHAPPGSNLTPETLIGNLERDYAARLMTEAQNRV